MPASSRRPFRLLWASLVALLVATGTARSERPNIVLILADDLGARDLGCYGADLHETPRVDALARDGVRFTRAYAPSPVCTPTRAALLTGRHPARLRMTTWAEGSLNPPRDRQLLEAPSRHDLPRTEVTLAKLLQASGYITALVGKWHLGDGNHAPEVHGFDVNVGGTHWGAPATFFHPFRGSGRFGAEMRYVPGLGIGKAGDYLTDRLTDEAIRFMDEASKRGKPFFLYLAHHAPHTPIEAPAEDVEYFKARIRPGMTHANATYAAMIRRLDTGVGRVLDRLGTLGIETNTVVVFASDNGGYIGIDARQKIPVTSNAPLRSGKASLHEGGIRVPLIVRWPGVTPAGATHGGMAVLTDLFPTLLAAAGVEPPKGVELDGIDLGSALRSPVDAPDSRPLHFHFPHHYHAPKTAPVSAVIRWPWKWVQHHGDGHGELFDLGTDPGEQADLSESRPDDAHRLRAELEGWLRSVDAAMPMPNPAHRATP